MASFWTRLRNIFSAKAHNALDKIENKIETLEQKVRDLESGHGKAVAGLAKVKALHIKYKNAAADYQNKAALYGVNAAKLKERFQSAEEGSEKEQLKADIILMLNKQENMKNESNQQLTLADNQDKVVVNLQTKIKEMTNLIKTTKASITNTKARSEAAEINKNVSKELSNVNFDGIGGQIEEIEASINNNNAEAESWSEIGNDLGDDEQRIAKMLNESSPTKDSKLFDEFMN